MQRFWQQITYRSCQLPQKPPFFYLLPGVGFGVEHDDERHAIPIQLPIPALKRIASDVSQLISSSGHPIVSASDQYRTSDLYDLWLELGGSATSLFPIKIPLYPQHTLQLSSLRENLCGLRYEEQSLDLEHLKSLLEKRGYFAQDSSTIIFPSHVYRLGVLDTPIIRSTKQGIMGEGKGFDAAQSECSALAEAIERIVASEPDLSRVLSGLSESQMTREGLLVPNVEPGARDLYSQDLCIDWTPAYLYPMNSAWMPAELVWHLYSPQCGFRAFDMRQTIGLAAGASITEAFANGLLEAIERDAYAIVMRCRITCPAVTEEEINACGPELTSLLSELNDKGIDLHIKWISLDWPVRIAHVLLVDRFDRIPAHAHGCSAALTSSVAITRAVLEAIQMHEGLARVASEGWERIAARIESSHSHPFYAWSDPLFRPHVAHLMNSNAVLTISMQSDYINQIEELCKWMMTRNHRIFWAHLGSLGGLDVVRVFVEGLVMPDGRMEYLGKRLSYWVNRLKIPGPYSDPILT